jgi:uncharacterized membrane protein
MMTKSYCKQSIAQGTRNLIEFNRTARALGERRRYHQAMLQSTLATTGLLGSALMAGTFYAFSAFVMRALARLPARDGIAAMQSINIAVINPWFLGVFMGMAGVGALAGVWAIIKWNQPGSGWLLLAGLSYVVGTFIVTVVGNVPLNNALAPLDPADHTSATLWAKYQHQWTIWNHVRAFAALVSTGAFAMACRHCGS